MPRTLVITNDFPPRKGGIQTFVGQLLSQLHAESVVVYTSNWTGAVQYDQTLPYPVIRTKGSVLLPTPLRMRRIKKLIQKYDCDQVLFGALAPLALLSKSLKRAGIKNVVALTHGHEAGWAKIPGLRFLLKRSAAHVDAVTYLTEFTNSIISPILNPKTFVAQLTPAVDTQRYQPVTEEQKLEIKKKYHVSDNLVMLGLSRLMPRKGFDSVIKAMPKLIVEFPNVKFVIAGGGPDQSRLLKLVESLNLKNHVIFLGSVAYQDLPNVYNMADLFVMPCRTRFAGLDVEGFGIVYLEAAASGLAVIAGNSGGAVEAVLPGRTGELVDSSNLFETIRNFLLDPKLRDRYGSAGRKWVISNFDLPSRGTLLQELLQRRIR